MIFSCIFEKNIHQLQKKLNARPYFFDRHRQPFHFLQKQPSRGILRKRCSENMEQIYMRTTVPMFDFNKLATQLFEFAYRHGCPPVNLLHNFWTSFPKNTSEGLLLLLVRYRFDIDANLQHGCIYHWLRKISLNSNWNFVRIKILFLQDILFEQLFV